MEDNTCLYDEDLNHVIDTIISIFDDQIARLSFLVNKEILPNIAERFQRIAAGNSYTFFTPRHIQEFMGEINENPDLFRFIMNMTDSINFALTTEDKYDEKLIRSVIKALTNTYVREFGSGKSLVPTDLKEQCLLTEEYIQNLLSNNRYLLYIYVVKNVFTSTKTGKLCLEAVEKVPSSNSGM